MTRWLRKSWSDRSGATAVEFAVVIGPFILLLLGSIEFGRALWSRQALQEVATIAARCAAIPQPACANMTAYDADKTLKMVLDLAAHNGLKLAESDVSIERSTSCSGLNGFTEASLSYDFDTPAKPLLGVFLDDLRFHADACYPNE